MWLYMLEVIAIYHSDNCTSFMLRSPALVNVSASSVINSFILLLAYIKLLKALQIVFAYKHQISILVTNYASKNI